MKEYMHIQNRKCEFFPCHASIPETEFNCMFCYCPLYALKDRCGGNFRYLENGTKDCSHCGIPHEKDGYMHILQYKQEMEQLGRKS